MNRENLQLRKICIIIQNNSINALIILLIILNITISSVFIVVIITQSKTYNNSNIKNILSDIRDLKTQDIFSPDVQITPTENEYYIGYAVFTVRTREEIDNLIGGEIFSYQINNKHEQYYEVVYPLNVIGNNEIGLVISDLVGNSSSYNYNITKTPDLDMKVPTQYIAGFSKSIVISNPSSILAVTNSEFKIPADYIPADLVSLEDYGIRNFYGGKIRKDVAKWYKKMQDALDQEGIDVKVTSAYRSFQSQTYTYNYIETYEGKTIAKSKVARPGHSEHQLGLALDLVNNETNYKLPYSGQQTRLYTWLQKHAYEFGFVQSYNQEDSEIYNELWHWRFVGIDIAKQIQSSSLSPIEYLSQINQEDF